MTDRKPHRHWFPLSIIQYALGLYHRFSLSQRDVQELLQERGIQVSHETLRQWNIKFAPLLTEELRHREPRRGSRWFLDEVCIEIKGKKLWLFLARTAPILAQNAHPYGGWALTTLGRWRAVDDSGAVLDLLLQDRRDTQAAKTFLGRLLANYDVPDVIHTDKLWSYGAAIRELPVLHSVEHVQVISTARCNNLIEQFHHPTRQQERSGQASSWGGVACSGASVHDDSCSAQEARLASRTKGEHRNSSPCMPAFQTFSSTPAPLFPPTSEDRTKSVPTWHGRTQLKWPSELQTATDTDSG